MKMNEEEMKTETAADEMQSGLSDAGEKELQEAFAAGNVEQTETLAGLESENWRLHRDTAALIREKIQEKMKDAVEPVKVRASDGSMAESGRVEPGDIEASGETAKSADAVVAPETDGAGPLTRREQRRKEKEAAAAQKAFRKEEESRRRQEAQEEKERQRRLAEEEKERKRYEKKTARSAVRQERRAEVKSLFHTAELVLLAVFILLAVDQAGFYGFLFVWLFVALTAVSAVLFLLGVVRAFRKKRCGIIFFAAIAGIILCTAWFIFLVSSRGLGLMQG